MEERREKLLAAIRDMFASNDPLPFVIKTICDGLENSGVHVGLAAIKPPDPTPLIENRIQQSDIAGMAVSQLGQRLGAFLTMQQKPRRRGPTGRK